MGKSLFIIGNGFDLNLGLKTSYNDYMNSDFFQRNLNNGSELFDFLSKQKSVLNWVDIEKELARYSLKFNGDSNCFLQDYNLLCCELKNYLKTLSTESINKNSKIYELFISAFGSNSLVLNFNYTDSISIILKDNGYNEEEISQCVFNVHGSIHGSNIIFGVDDGSRINDDHTFLYKSTSNIFQGKLFPIKISDFKNIIIMGHSLGESDHMYFEFFHDLTVSKFHDKALILCYYKDEGKYQLYKQLHSLSSHGVSKIKTNIDFKEFNLYYEC